MSKRRPPPTSDDSSRPLKRARPDHHPAPAIEEIHSARQLQDLAFSGQDAQSLQHLRKGIASCKALLESVLYRKDPDDWGRHVGILTEWLDSQKGAEGRRGEEEGEGGMQEQPFLPDLWQALSFSLSAGQNDALTSSILSLLALLMKTLSALLEFRSHGLLLARSVLRQPQLGMVRKCLEAPKHKEFLISPGVRLLSEVVGFDGGVLVREVWRRREEGTVGWRWVGRGLGMVKNE